MATMLQIDSRAVTRQSLLGKQKVEFGEIDSIHKMKVLGTVANSPLLIRNVIFRMKSGEFNTLKTAVFPWYLVLDLLDEIEKKLETN